MPNVNSQTIYQMGNLVNDVVKQATGRDPVQSIEMANVSVAQNTLLGIETLSGSVVRFRTPRSVPLLSLEAQIVAQQNLHGYDYPWPGGGGKNKLSVDTLSLGGTEPRTKRFDIASIPAGTYKLTAVNSGTETNTESFGFQFFETSSSTTAIGTAHADNTEFTLTAEATSVYCYMSTSSYENEKTVELSNMMIRLSTVENDDFEPYANICPITGFTGCNFSVSNDDTPERIYPVEWETEAGTVYGGVLDAKNGKLTVNTIMRIFNGTEEWGRVGGSNPYYRVSLYSISTILTTGTTLCSHFRKALIGSTTSEFGYSIFRSSGNLDVCAIRPDMTKYETVDLFKSFLSEQSTNQTPVQIIYQLINPVEYDVFPVSINTLAGDNVISADTGDISLSYYVYSDLL